MSAKSDPYAPDNWPFLGREADLEKCWRFLLPGDVNAPSCRIHITGDSGVGKSFFVAELICRFASLDPAAMCLYADVPEPDIDASQIESQLQAIAAAPRTPSRGDPQQVPVDAAGTTYLHSVPWQGALRTGYRFTRNLTDAIPFAGRAIKNTLPEDIAIRTQRDLLGAGRFWEFVIAEARRRCVLVAIDNVQRLPDAVISQLTLQVPHAATGLRLITTERAESNRPQRKLRLLDYNQLDIELTGLSREEALELIRSVLKDRVSNRDEVADALYRITKGNPKLIWYQLQALAPQPGQRSELAAKTYEETIKCLPDLGKLALRVVTLLLAFELSHLVRLLCFMHPVPTEEVRQTIEDLRSVHLLKVNGSNHNRVRPEHDLVSTSVRLLTNEDEQLELRHLAIEALGQRLSLKFESHEYERFVSAIVQLQFPEELWRRGLQSHVISLISSQRRRENFEYLTTLFSACTGVLKFLPADCLVAFLNAFQKVSLFAEGRAAVQLMRESGTTLGAGALSMFDAKFLVQLFDYQEAKKILLAIDPGPDRDVILFNILLNECRDEDARGMIALLPMNDIDLDEAHCVMLRNSGHLYEPGTARTLIVRARSRFIQLRSRFGEATAWNNLGVLELGCGNHVEAQRSFDMAYRLLISLKSNEVYQPLTNLAALAAIEGDTASAARLLAEADAMVPKSLRMDAIMMEFNAFTLDLIDGRLSLSDAAAEAIRLHERARDETEDDRFKRLTGWIAAQLEAAQWGWPSIESLSDFVHVRENGLGAMEVYKNVTIEGQSITAAIQLSPHWRY